MAAPRRATRRRFAALLQRRALLSVHRPNESATDDRIKVVLTKKGKYGLKAMVHLAGLEPGELAQVANIAETNSISKKFLDHILSDLRHAGLVYSKKGKGGGYALSRPAHEIRVGAIVRAIDGPLAPIPCASVTAFRPCDDCGDFKSCSVRLIMVEARNAIVDVLDQCTLAEMRARADPRDLAYMYHI
jgi:Rrf2 family protein